MKFEIFRSIAGQWCWRARSRNGKIVADGAEGYKTRGNARTAVKRFIAQIATHAATIKVWERDT